MINKNTKKDKKIVVFLNVMSSGYLKTTIICTEALHSCIQAYLYVWLCAHLRAL